MGEGHESGNGRLDRLQQFRLLLGGHETPIVILIMTPAHRITTCDNMELTPQNVLSK